MGSGEYFGEQALIYNITRTATITATSNVKCIAIGRDRLMQILGTGLINIICKNSIVFAIESCQKLKNLPKSSIQGILDSIEVREISDQQVAIQQGTRKNAGIWILLSGELLDGKSQPYASKFDIIGTEFIGVNCEEQFEEDIICRGSVNLGFLSQEILQKVVGGSFSEVTEQEELINAIKSVHILRNLSQSQIQHLIDQFECFEYRPGDIIIHEDQPGNSLFIIKSGSVQISKNGRRVRKLIKLDYFGERALLFQENRSASVKAVGDVVCWGITRQSFFEILDEKMRLELLKRIQLQDDSIDIQDLITIKELGSGNFGKVYLTARQQNRNLYALKVIEREKVNQFDLHENIEQEKSILQQLNHNFIIKLIKSYEDESNFYLLMEYVRGMDMFDVLQAKGICNDSEASFYVAGLILILEYLHERNIIYRDLKPENIMIDEDGYPKLIDFGISKIIESRTYTLIGTPQYMAPEVILGKGYSLMADYWSLGIVAYETLTGKVPFGNKQTDPYEIYNAILKQKLEFPSSLKSKSAQSFLTMLLQKNPGHRLNGGFSFLKRHTFLQHTNWHAISEKRIRAPYKPVIPGLGKVINDAFKQRNNISNQNCFNGSH